MQLRIMRKNHQLAHCESLDCRYMGQEVRPLLRPSRVLLDGPIREQLVSDAGPLYSIVFHWVIERLSSSRLNEHERDVSS